MDHESIELDDQTDHAPLPPPMQALCSEAGEIWDRYENEREFRGFVAADYEAIYQVLVQLQGRVATVLEWGSGLGVITIMASGLGFDACGIEIEPELVDLSRDLAGKYGPQARFATGNFIPDHYEWSPEYGDGDFRTTSEAASGYEELDMELRDFDLVYAYPWPNEQPMYHDIMRQCGGKNSLYLGYDVREGASLSRFGRRR